jgi:hypothetical protein
MIRADVVYMLPACMVSLHLTRVVYIHHVGFMEGRTR